MTASSAENLGPEKSAAQSFVINLASSTSPMALSHPSSPELKKYTFFVSRQREDGRERFRLHMGYFASQEEAEQLLAAVRDVYPAAWAGPAPANGVARRGRIAPVQLAPELAQAAGSAAAPVAAKPVEPAPMPAPLPAAPMPVAAAPVEPAVKPAAPPAKQPGTIMALEQSMSDMRSVLAQLGDEAPAAGAKAPVPAVPPTVQPALRVEPPRLQPAVQKAAVAAAKPVVAKPAELTPVQTLQVLETPPARSASASQDSPFEGLENEPDVRVVTPEDTQTLTDIKLDKANNAPPCFAVQLVWSATPIDISAMAHLAIFDAYTLYNVEGNRQGRKWYGLRLGFFSDPHSATQVANYVRSDYRAVAVVPVAVKERDRARGAVGGSSEAAPLKAAEQLSTATEAMNGFELLADDRPAPPKRDLDMPVDPKAAAAALRAKLVKQLGPPPAAPTTPKIPGKATGKPVGKRVVVRKKPEDAVVRGAPGTGDVLESTLEILGASTLSLDEGGGKVISDSRARKPRTADKKAASGKFAKLLGRLGGG